MSCGHICHGSYVMDHMSIETTIGSMIETPIESMLQFFLSIPHDLSTHQVYWNDLMTQIFRDPCHQGRLAKIDRVCL